jgi:molybdate transport system substrate-binding protein
MRLLRSSISARVIVAGTGAVLSAVTPARAQSPAPRPATLTVFAAASLTEAFGELGRQLEHSHPGLTVRFNFAGSQQLVAQLEQGASADVFASADQRWMTSARDKGLVTGDAPIFARNRLVAIVPRTNPARINRLQDLARRGTKVVMAADVVPAGKYSREALEKLAGLPGFGPDYDRRVLANVVSQEENVKAVVTKVQLGEADAGLVYRSDVTQPVARYVRVFEIPDSANVIAAYPIAITKAAANADAAREFVALVRGQAGQQVLRKAGFLPAK